MALTQITAEVIADNSVTTTLIADDVVTAAKIASVPVAVGITSVVTATSLTAAVNTHIMSCGHSDYYTARFSKPRTESPCYNR